MIIVGLDWSPPSEITLELHELLRWREEIVQQRTAAYQRLRPLLARNWQDCAIIWTASGSWIY